MAKNLGNKLGKLLILLGALGALAWCAQQVLNNYLANLYERRARALLADYELADALAPLQAAYSRNPNNLEVLLELARLQRRLGNYTEALELLNKYEAAGGPSEHYVLERRLVEIQRGNPERFVIHVTESLKHDFPEKELVLEALCKGLIDSGHHGEARHFLQQWQDLNPKSVGPHLGMARLAMAMHQNLRIEELVDSALAINPRHSEALILKAMSFSHAAAPTEAVEILERLEKRYPESTLVLTQLADAYLKAGRSDEAEAVVNHLDRIDFGTRTAIMVRGKIAMERQQYDKAEICFKTILDGEGGYSEAIEQYIGALRMQAKVDEMAPWEKRLKLILDSNRKVYSMRADLPAHSQDADFLFELADAYLNSNNLAEGVNFLQEALKLNPNHEGARRVMRELNSGKGRFGPMDGTSGPSNPN